MRHDNFINGEWVTAAEYRPNVNPSDTADIVGEYAWADAADTRLAIEAARAAFPAWRGTGIQRRHDALDAIGNEILARSREIGELLAREEGKTLAEGVGETVRAGQIFKFFAGETLRLRGEMLPSVRPGVDIEVFRQPIGVVGLITPWNFPIAIPAWKIAPALAYGNCVVFKPAELTPGCAWTLAEIISRNGLPPGVFNLVMGAGPVVGQSIVAAPAVDAISFTGSAATGRRILGLAAERGAKVQLEMGGKNPLVVLDDADFDVAVNCAVSSAYFSTGQRCTASSRIIATPGIHDRLVQGIVDRLAGLRVDHALKQGTDIGPVVDGVQLEKNLKYVDIARREGGRLLFGGEVVERATRGFYQIPALLTDTTAEMTINREEVFGPVASVLRADGFEHAVQLANGIEAGLSAGICTASLKDAAHFKRVAEAGMVMVNVPTAGVDYHVPFGGTKASSYGPREQGSHACEFYTRVKTAYTCPGEL